MTDISRSDKLKLLQLDDDIKLSDEYVDILYNKLKTKLKKEEIKPTLPKLKTNNDDPKYIVLLKFVNQILTNINKPNITALEQFENIDREEIIKPINMETFSNMENEIFEHFDKVKCGWYSRNKLKNYILTFFRYACGILGYSFTYISKNTMSKSVFKTKFFYSIK